MVHITSLVMEKMQFNNFPIINLWELSVAWQANQEVHHHNFSYFELPLPKQHLYQIRVILLDWFWRSCHLKKILFLKFNVTMATKQNGHWT